MPAAPPTIAGRPSQPDPHRAEEPTLLPRIAQLLAIVRSLLGYGENLAQSLPRHVADGFAFARFASHFGTLDMAQIAARIRRAMLRLRALEALLLERAAKGKDINPIANRTGLPRLCVPRQDGQAAAPPAPARAPRSDDIDLDHPPTEAGIAAEVRRRPPGATLAAICRDLGLSLRDFRSNQALQQAIWEYRGDLLRLTREIMRRQVPLEEIWYQDQSEAAARAAAFLARLAPGATGPPARAALDKAA